jgi:septation ring formation regulator EzrA
LPIDTETLKSERDQLKKTLREIEIKQREVDAELKGLRQQEIKTKREIEALSTLIEINEGRPPKDDEQGPADEAQSDGQQE